MPNIALSEVRVKALRPRPSAYDIRDAKLRGFGVRVLPSGAKRFFIHTQHRGQRVWKIVGDAGATNVDEARARCKDRALSESPPRGMFARTPRHLYAQDPARDTHCSLVLPPEPHHHQPAAGLSGRTVSW